jgi:amidophosphoribosyltransferase
VKFGTNGITREPSIKEECGVFGVYLPGADVARIAFFGLYALQHRGQESAGIATTDGKAIAVHRGMGLVAQVFDEASLEPLKGFAALGHTRYSTTGSSRVENAQPMLVGEGHRQLALAHNGNLVNLEELMAHPASSGLLSSSDSELIAKFIAFEATQGIEAAIEKFIEVAQGSYSLGILTRDAIYAVRDPWGNRPLSLGRLDGGWAIASESCALATVGAEYVRDIAPGEILRIDARGPRSRISARRERRAFCLFELIYLSRPDSRIGGRTVNAVRNAMGRELAREHPIKGDIVMGIPDSATPAAIGYAQASGIPYSEGLIKNRYIGRTFIQPDDRLRRLGVALKFNPLPDTVAGRRVIVVDDSIVRGNTIKPLAEMLRKAGAVEIHLRVASPPIRYPCFYGVDIASSGELVAHRRDVDEIARLMGVDSLAYLSLEGMWRALETTGDGFCTACFTGNYPIGRRELADKMVLERRP